ncbi:MAG: GreA/GreB family elongation factor [Chitinophagaceae bacterium]|nr:GreA/GreB family elongation factor [Chitinophagaceae bacterium]
MSRGFVKEGDQEEIPLIAPRAPLPAGVANYVTPTGFNLLMEEKEALEEEKRNLPPGNEGERRRAALFIDGKLKLLNERIASARILDSKNQTKDVIRFGAVVEFLNGKKHMKFQIVGVDEADIKQSKVAFTSPIARVLIGKKKDETADFKRGDKTQRLKILSISYPE